MSVVDFSGYFFCYPFTRVQYAVPIDISQLFIYLFIHLYMNYINLSVFDALYNYKEENNDHSVV